MIHVAIVNVGSEFDPIYVRNLVSGVDRHLSLDHDFTIITNNSKNYPEFRTVNPIMEIPPSWWYKIELFRPDLWSKGEQVLYIDLDSIVVNSLDKLATREGFSMLAWGGPWYPVGSGVLVFQSGEYSFLWNSWRSEYRVLYKKGDQEFIHKTLIKNGVEINPILNSEVASIKRDAWVFGPAGAKPETRNASVVAFHGKPRPHEVPEGHWAYHEWRKS